MSTTLAPITATTLQLPEVLDLKAAAPLLGDLLAMRGRDVSLDASQVRRIGGQCLQVLLSATATWKADAASLEIVNPSPEFAEALELLGVRKELFA
jgi:chemotaxis protein CheX